MDELVKSVFRVVPIFVIVVVAAANAHADLASPARPMLVAQPQAGAAVSTPLRPHIPWLTRERLKRDRARAIGQRWFRRHPEWAKLRRSWQLHQHPEWAESRKLWLLHHHHRGGD